MLFSEVFMKNFKFLLAAAAIFIVFASCSAKKSADSRKSVEDGKTVVERYGQLQVCGTNLCDRNGNPVQLRGMSSHGLQWHGKFANEDVIRFLRDDWNCQIWRAAMYVTEGGYINSPSVKNKVIDSIEACRNLGMYVIVDWHILGTGNPLVHKEQAKEFFADIAERYGNLPNIIYEICNEPNGEDATWNEAIRPYAEEIIAQIRKFDEKNIIIVGTPNWSRDVDAASENPLNEKNVMYSLHFYAGSHGKELQKKIRTAQKNGAAIFVTEWGATKETGDGGIFQKETIAWLKFLERNNISWANWSVNNKGEDSGVLKYNADRFGRGNWRDEDLSEDGIFIRSILRGETK
jgi:endoglucanase